MSMFGSSSLRFPPALIAPIVIIPTLIVITVIWKIVRHARSHVQFSGAYNAPPRDTQFAVDVPSYSAGNAQWSSAPYYPQGRPAVPAVSMGMGRPAYYPPVTVPDSNPAVLTPYVPSGTAHEIHDPSNPYTPYSTQPSGLTQPPHPTQSRHSHATGSSHTPYTSATPRLSPTGPPIATRTQNDIPPIYTHNPTTGSPITHPLSSLQTAGRSSALVPTPRPQIPTLAEIRTLSRAPSVNNPPDRVISPAPTIGSYYTTGTAPPPYNEFRV